jgi:nucleotide-binding universal stress UspA family protein
MDEAERKLLTLGEQEFGPTVAFDVLVQSGRPYREIINAGKAFSVDLIVMGIGGSTKRHSGTAERVVRYAPCPVLVIHEKEHNLGDAKQSAPSIFSQRLRMRGG